MNSGTPSKTKAVFDTSPLILLDFLGYASLLPGLYEAFIPPRVAEELTVRPGDAGSKLPEEPWVHQQAPNPLTLERVSRELAADPGEESAVALAVGLRQVFNRVSC
jgi:predicted nucleic acid-binding protein